MTTRLIGDLGGTHCRLALSINGGAPSQERTLQAADFSTLESALQHYLAEVAAAPTQACLAVAGAVSRAPFRMTNLDWQCDGAALQQQLKISRVAFINDFEAIALAIPALSDAQMLDLGGAPDPGKPSTVLGPGTGLGVALLLPTDSGFVAVATEGGHVSLQADTPAEQEVFEYWRRRGLPLSRETLLSGNGLQRIYQAIAQSSGAPAANGREVSARAAAGEATAIDAIAMFMALLGSAAGDQALSCGARGGVYLAGGILPKLRKHLENSDFRQRFDNKPPMQHYLQEIGVRLITHDNPGLLGAARHAFVD